VQSEKLKAMIDVKANAKADAAIAKNTPRQT